LSDVAAEHELDTAARLLEAAGPVFAARGFDRATVREICSAAGVNVASVGYHFGDKMGLYRTLIRSIRDARERQFPDPDNDTADPAEVLGKIVHTMLSRILAADPSGWESQLFMREMQNPTPVFEDIVREFFKPLFDRLVSLLDQLVRRANPGSIATVPDHVTRQLALSVVGQCVYYKVGAGVIEILIPKEQRQNHYDIDTLSRHITAFSLAAANQTSLQP
jgi:TetR/AcrR family transcriptional regulator, regulator of cefoperazone and chloramphenicol sensitivity